MAEAAVTFILQQLKDIVVGYKDLITGAATELKKMKDELELFKAFLKETADKKNKNHMFRNLEKQIINVVFEVETTIDHYLTERMTFRKRFLFSSNKLAKKVKSIRTDKVQPLLADFKNLMNMQTVAAYGAGIDYHPPPQPKPPDIPIRKNKIIGFEEEERKITGYLMEKTEKLNVISIIGIPGQGKTALAWKIYQNMGSDFTKRIWIYISQQFNIRDILLQILGKFSPVDDNFRPKDEELPKAVRLILENEKFLLVLDDVWSVNAWNEIKKVLPENNRHAKVLITSRETNVGLQTKVYTDPHILGSLNKSEGRELLKYEVFGNSVVPNSDTNLTDITDKIADKCGGVPLTIVLIGGILAYQLNTSLSTALSEWKIVADSVSDALQYDEAPQQIKEVIELSYNNLPDDLRECFVYMGVFPEDYEIPTNMLYGLWISEGFINPKNIRQSLEQRAEQNLNDLISRNLIHVEKTNHMGRVKTCRVHDMIRAFCVAKLREDKFFHEVKKLWKGEFIPSLGDLQNSRGLSFSSDLSMFLSQNPGGPHVRSFLCLYDRPVELEENHINAIPTGFSKLRILESRCIKFHKFPGKVTKLIHLRYLTLNIDTLETIPKPVMDLWNLQSLLIETKSRTIVMKANMWKMIRLRYLRTKAAIVLDGEWKGDAGGNLHTLNRLSPESCTKRVADKAINLRTLGISGKLAKIFDNKFLEKLHHLEKLKLVNDLAYEQTYDDRLHSLPKWNCFPPYLKSLTLTNTFITWQHMSTLAKIKSLEVLKLRDNAFVGVSWNLGGDIFLNLQLLLIMNLRELVLWEATDQAFLKLKFLVVKNCKNLREIPKCLGTHLEKLEIERVQNSVVISAKKIGKMKKKEGIQFNLTIGPASGSN